jgi:hypothetical protein
MADKLMEEFASVDDLYVLERLYGAIYGALLTCRDPDAVGKVARRVYSQVFEDGHPPVHLQLRDYASGIVEWALEVCGELGGVNRAMIRPPYKSPWPVRAPKLRREFEGQDSPYRSIRFVVMEWDFHRKVIEPAVRKFLLPDQTQRQQQEKRRRLLEAKVWEEILQSGLTPDQVELQKEALQADSQEALWTFYRSLDEEQKTQLRFARFAFQSAKQPTGTLRFDTDLASRWVANRVVALVVVHPEAGEAGRGGEPLEQPNAGELEGGGKVVNTPIAPPRLAR